MLREWGEKLIGTLPPAFVVLVAFNIVFLVVVLWFLDRWSAQRIELVKHLLDSCLAK